MSTLVYRKGKLVGELRFGSGSPVALSPVGFAQKPPKPTLTLGRLEGLAKVAKRAARRNWSDDDMQAFDDAFTPEVCAQLVGAVSASIQHEETAR